jgi:pilus assembly protein Flp/PilA
MKLIVSTLRGALKDRRGITALEYGLIAALITVGIIGTLGLIGPKLANVFTNINALLP